jgi:hypothetical protein
LIYNYFDHLDKYLKTDKIIGFIPFFALKNSVICAEICKRIYGHRRALLFCGLWPYEKDIHPRSFIRDS